MQLLFPSSSSFPESGYGEQHSHGEHSLEKSSCTLAGVFVKVFIVCNSFPLYLSGWQNLQLGNVLIQHSPLTRSLFITGIKILSQRAQQTRKAKQEEGLDPVPH